MQKICLIGNLVKDAVVIDTKRTDARQMIAFRLACNESFGAARITTYYDIYKPLDKSLEYLKKGEKVYVEGKPFQRNTEKKADLCVDCSYLEFLATKKPAQTPAVNPPVTVKKIEFNKEKL